MPLLISSQHHYYMAFNPSSSGLDREKDCWEIHNAWGRLSHLSQALAHRTQPECRKIRETYMTMYGEDLVDQIQKTQLANPKNEVCGLLSLWMCDSHERDAVVARDALAHGDTKYQALVEIYIGRKSSHLLLVQHAYQTRFMTHLDQDISSEPPTPYQRILVALATSHRSHHMDISQHIAKCDAKRLYQAGDGRTGSTDETTILEILSKRSIQQLKLTFSCYKHIYGYDYTKSLKKDTSGEFEDSLRAVVKGIYNPPKYYAKMLHTSMKGRTTDRSALSRVIVSRAETDMDDIQEVYKKKYGKKLQDDICESIPEGDYRDFLVAIVTKPPSTS